MSYSLTNDSDYLLCVLYRHYKDRRKNGISKNKAKFFGGSEYIFNNLLPEWTFEDVDETCRELSRAGLLNCKYADNVVWTASLSDDAIIYMENRFKNGISEVIDNIARLKSLIS